MANNLTSELVRSILNYDPEIGIFTWKYRSGAAKAWNTRYSGKTAGSVNKDGYVQIAINNKQYYAHRLAWLYTKGIWPEIQIDHRDLNKSNNKWKNLRKSGSSGNRSNTKIRADSISGIKGVWFDKKRKKYSAQITTQKKHISLGRFDSPEDAYVAYCKAAEKYHGEFARVA